MPEKNVFAENLDALINKYDINVKSLVMVGDEVTYGYVLRVRRGDNCPTVLKATAIINIIKRHPAASSVELWMFFVPGFFLSNSKNIFGCDKRNQIVSLLIDASELGILPSTEEQRHSVERLANVIQKRNSQW